MTIPGEWKNLGTFKTGSDDPGDVDLSGTGQLAPTGQAQDSGTGSGHSIVSTPDGTEIIGTGGNLSYDLPLAINAYALPSTRLLWSVKTPQYYTDTVEAINASVILIARAQNGSGDNSVEYLALDVKTGRVVWSQKIVGATVCDLTSSQILVDANNQRATLDAATGKQLSYKDGSGCPRVVATGLTGVGYDEKQVLQILNP
jgi:outer membrane protein assembly factor BamB